MIIEDSKARKTPLHKEHNEMAGDGINVDLSTYMYVQVAGDRSRARARPRPLTHWWCVRLIRCCAACVKQLADRLAWQRRSSPPAAPAAPH